MGEPATMNQPSTDYLPPPTSVYQRIVGNDNIVVGYVSHGATVNITHRNRLTDIQQMLDQARVAYRENDYKKALAWAENAVRRLQPGDPPQIEADIKLLLGYSAFFQYRKVRDKRLIVENAVPAFESVTEIPLHTGAANYKGEAFAYLAWCKAYLGDLYVDSYAKKASAELGAYNDLAVWARRASLRAKVREGAIAGGATIGIVLVWIVVVVVAIFVIGGVLTWLGTHALVLLIYCPVLIRSGHWEPCREPSARTTSCARRAVPDRQMAIMPTRGPIRTMLNA
jgi:hypothetical protein